MKKHLCKQFADPVYEGIAGPHEVYGAQLMLAGLKPVMLTDHVGLSERQKRLLDTAVAEGRLKFHMIRAEEITKDYGYDVPDAWFYCQPEHENDMRELVDFYRALWSEKIPDISPLRHIRNATILGYSENDVALFLNRIYGPMGGPYTPERIEYLYKTSDQRRDQRYAHLSPR